MTDQVSDVVRLVLPRHDEAATDLQRFMSLKHPTAKYIAFIVDPASEADRNASLIGTFTKADVKAILKRTLEAL